MSVGIILIYRGKKGREEGLKERRKRNKDGEGRRKRREERKRGEEAEK